MPDPKHPLFGEPVPPAPGSQPRSTEDRHRLAQQMAEDAQAVSSSVEPNEGQLDRSDVEILYRATTLYFIKVAARMEPLHTDERGSRVYELAQKARQLLAEGLSELHEDLPHFASMDLATPEGQKDYTDAVIIGGILALLDDRKGSSDFFDTLLGKDEVVDDKEK